MRTKRGKLSTRNHCKFRVEVFSITPTTLITNQTQISVCNNISKYLYVEDKVNKINAISCVTFLPRYSSNITNAISGILIPDSQLILLV